jgi:hypothetical protein
LTLGVLASKSSSEVTIVKSIKQQAGLSTIMLIIIVGLFGYAVYIGLKITPVYMEYFSIKSAVDGLADEMKSRQISKTQYLDLMRRRLEINYVDVGALTPSRDGCNVSKKDVFHYKSHKKGVDVGITYEKRVPAIANLDFLVSFDYMRTVKSPAK